MMATLARQETRIPIKIPPYLFFLAPSIVLVAIFTVYPIVTVFQMSFTDMRFATDAPNFNGLANYEWAFNNRFFMTSFNNTVTFTVYSLIGHTVMGLFFASLLNQPKLWGINIYRMVVLFTWILPEIVMAAVMAVIFGSNIGIVNHVFELIGIQRVAWLNDPRVALNTLILISLWRGFPFNTLMYLTALQGINNELYEAGDVDGANLWQKFWYITLPQMMPTIVSVLIIGTIGVANAFFTPFIITGGGPLNATQLWSLSIYDTVFQNQQLARGSAMSVIVFGALLSVSMIYYVILRRVSEKAEV